MSIERRFHPRKDVNFSVSIALDNSNEQLTGTAVNLSLSGIQLKVDKPCVDLILRQCNHPAQFQLLFSDSTKVDPYTVRVIVNRRKSQNQFLLGLKFIDISAEQISTIETLLNQ